MKVRLPNVCLVYSYETCIAASGYVDGKWMQIRLPNDWGPTTGKHFNESGASSFTVIKDDAEFQSLVKAMVVESVEKEVVGRVVNR